MDFYAIKFMATSTLTAETFVGYLFGKKKQDPTFNVAVLTKNKLSQYKLPDIKKNYINFKSDIDLLVYNLSKDKKTAPLNRQFKAYFYTTLKKYGLDIISTKLFLAVQDGDPFVLKAIISDILQDWGSDTNIRLIAEKFNYEDLTWISSAIRNGDEGSYEYLKRADVVDAIEVFPVIDPLDGYPIIKLDVGDPIYVLELSDKDNKKPKTSIEGSLISKELIPGSDYMFLKVDLGDNLIGKTVIQKNLKVSIDNYKLEYSRKKREEMLEEDHEKIIGDIAEEILGKKSFNNSKMSSADIILIFSFSVIGILFIVLLGLWLGAF